MADNVTADPGSGGAVFASDDIGGVHYPRSKQVFGPDGSATDVAPGAGLPIQHSRPTVATATWNSSTADEATLELDVTGHASATIGIVKTGTIDTGDVAFEVTDGGAAWVAVYGSRLASIPGVENSYSLVSGTLPAIWQFDVGGLTKIRIRLNTVITNTGSVDIRIAASSAARTFKAQLTGVDQSLIVNTELSAAGLLGDGDANPSTAKVGACLMGLSGSSWDRITGTAANGLDVDVTRMPLDANATEVQGTVADDAADAQNPVGIGATARTSNRTSVVEGDRVRAIADDQGRLVVVPGHVRDLVDHQHTQIANSTTETTIVTAVASEFHDLVALVLTNQSATAVNVTIKDSTTGTTRMIIALAANGGAVLTFPVPVPQKAAVNNNWTATLSVNTVTVNIFAQFLKNV